MYQKETNAPLDTFLLLLLLLLQLAGLSVPIATGRAPTWYYWWGIESPHFGASSVPAAIEFHLQIHATSNSTLSTARQPATSHGRPRTFWGLSEASREVLTSCSREASPAVVTARESATFSRSSVQSCHPLTMADDLFDGDEDLFGAFEPSGASTTRIQQPVPQKIQQPVPQRLDKAPPVGSSAPKVVQPTPQALAKPSSGSAILVSPRQRGNPVLASLKSIPWEYSDIPADYGLGLTTGALFLR